MSSNPTEKMRKSPLKQPGELVGPMRLPISYDVNNYRVKRVGGKNGKIKIIGPKRRRSASGANRYKESKLLDGAPIP